MTDQTLLQQASAIAATLNEEDATTLLYELTDRHNWVRATLTSTDVSQFIADRRKADDLNPLSETELHNATKHVVESKQWSTTIPDWLNEQAFEALGDTLDEFDSNTHGNWMCQTCGRTLFDGHSHQDS